MAEMVSYPDTNHTEPCFSKPLETGAFNVLKSVATNLAIRNFTLFLSPFNIHVLNYLHKVKVLSPGTSLPRKNLQKKKKWIKFQHNITYVSLEKYPSGADLMRITTKDDPARTREGREDRYGYVSS